MNKNMKYMDETNIKFLVSKRDYKDMNLFLEDSYLVFNLRQTNYITNKVIPSIIFRGVYMKKDIVDRSLDNMDYTIFRLISLGLTEVVINIFSQGFLRFTSESYVFTNPDSNKEVLINPSSDKELIAYIPVYDRLVSDNEGTKFKLRLRYFDTKDLTNKDALSIIDFKDLDSQFFIAKDTDWETLKHIFILQNYTLSGGNPSLRQWCSNQDYHLSLFINGLLSCSLDRNSFLNQNRLLQSSFYTQFKQHELGHIFKSNLSISDVFVKNDGINVKSDLLKKCLKL